MFKHILLATDGSPSSEHAAQMAIGLSRSHGAQLTVVFVADPFPYMGIGEMNPLGYQAYTAAAQEVSARAFTHVAELAGEAGVGMQARLVENVQAHKGVLQVAQDEAVDLIVVGSHGRSGIERLVMGGVAHKIVAQSTRPVLVAR